MHRLLRVLLMALLLGTQVGTTHVPPDAACQDASDCCPRENVCDVNCLACACCPGQASSVTSAPIMIEFVGVPPAPANCAASIAVLPLFSTDILHVPKSV